MSNLNIKVIYDEEMTDGEVLHGITSHFSTRDEANDFIKSLDDLCYNIEIFDLDNL